MLATLMISVRHGKKKKKKNKFLRRGESTRKRKSRDANLGFRGW
jgi:hypothetical protein